MNSGNMKPEAQASSTLRRVFERVLTATDLVSYWAIIAAMSMMTLLVAAQVFTRYVLDMSIDSADELSRLFFVWAIFLAIPHGIKSGIHVGIDAVVMKLSPLWRQRLARITAILSAVLMIILFFSAAQSVGEKWQELMPTIELTAAVFYIAVLICAGHSLMHLIAQIFRRD